MDILTRWANLSDRFLARDQTELDLTRSTFTMIMYSEVRVLLEGEQRFWRVVRDPKTHIAFQMQLGDYCTSAQVDHMVSIVPKPLTAEGEQALQHIQDMITSLELQA